MSDLIRRAALFNALSTLNEKADIFTAINNAPAVDAVQVVRCRDCWKNYIGEKEWNKGEIIPLTECPVHRDFDAVDPDFYCAFGERRESKL